MDEEGAYKLDETVASGVVEPWVVVGASDAGVKVKGFSGQLLGGQLAPVGGNAGWSGLDGALFLPGLEGSSLVDVLGVLDPLDDLGHGDEVHVIVVAQDLVNPVQEGVQELGVVLQPGSVEEQAKRSTVLVVVTIEVVCQKVVELISAQDVGA